MDQPEPKDVHLYIYDLTKGLARQLSLALLNKQIDGIWHTGIVVYGREYFFGGGGIESCRPCGTILGQPTQVHKIGSTQVSYSLFLEYLGEMGMSAFSGDTYNLINHNCNNFSNEVAQFLTGNSIPAHITDLPQEVLNTPIGQAMKPLIDALAYNPTGNRPDSEGGPSVYDAQASGAGGKPLPATQTASTSTSTKESTEKSEEASKPKKAPEATYNEEEEEDNDLFLKKLRERRQSRSITRLCLFRDGDPAAFTDSIKQHLPQSLLTADEMMILDQMKDAFQAPSDSLLDDDWDKTLPPVKPDYFLVIGKLLGRTDLPPVVLVPLLQLLQLAFLREDVIGLLCTNEDRTIIDFVSRAEGQPQKVQVEIIHLLCNMCASSQGYAWVISEKEWKAPSANGSSTSNMKIIKAIVIAMLLSGSDQLCEAAASLVFNFTRHKLVDDNAVDFGSALLQVLSTGEFSEPTVYYGIGSLYGLMGNVEVLCLANVMGFNTDKWVGLSDRINQIIYDMCLLLEEK
ncbi:uncharacterized protein LOC593529 [Strongylocentrotus purpuratus]|uniref:PPPDE domain-containing protein n=1 Tax=Strongylocentrotus purpuratus TaxID=7668 RepID=A0A7M7SYG4_STRPU|nr:uncharacterized protein LOC593529 [Strongylocentrotus purpuratus]|eukprot:XP_798093.3 PREDICTED: uncharacterized protein LOC593529 [Strongylocentrotus purpuratus]